MRSDRVVFLSVMLLIVPMLVAPVAAQPGLGGGFTGTRLEGENYHTSGSLCDGYDGETAHVGYGLDSSNGAYVFLPGEYCTVTFHDIEFPGPGHFTSARVIMEGPSYIGEQVITVAVYVNGVKVTSASGIFSHQSPANVLSFPVGSIASGTHDVTLAYESSIEWLNLDIDYLDYEIVYPCEEDVPTFQSLVGDGMSDGFVGWARHSYTFGAVATMDDGRDVRLRWNFGNGEQRQGSSATAAFATPGSYTVRVIAEVAESPCADVPTTETTFTFHVHADWQPTLRAPGEYRACVNNARVFATTNVIAGACSLWGEAGVGAGAAAFAPRTVFLLDGVEYAGVDGTRLVAQYDSFEHSPGQHELSVCASESTDKYRREFCSAPYRFLNVGLL